MRHTKVRQGQLRRWVDAEEDAHLLSPFLVLRRGKVNLPGADWSQNGWWTLCEGRERWFYAGDVEKCSVVVSDPAQESLSAG